MNNPTTTLFDIPTLNMVRSFVSQHHLMYLDIPPQGIYFESLVERTLTALGHTVVRTNPNAPTHDIMVESSRISIKSQTGRSTATRTIMITKLCTTETEPWDASTLIQKMLGHLSQYDHIFMLRAIWRPQPQPKRGIVARAFHYQLIDIPLTVLRLATHATPVAVGTRKGRPSLACDVLDGCEKVFRLHFDGADGKCQVHNLLIRRCRILLEWDHLIRTSTRLGSVIHICPTCGRPTNSNAVAEHDELSSTEGP